MGLFFTGSELANIAVGIEQSGAAYYDSLAQSAKDDKSRSMWKYLALEEKKHIEIFRRMLGSLSDYAPPETYTEEYDLYLRALIDSAVFRNDEVARAMAQKVDNASEAIMIALSAEKDSILFYLNLRELVLRPQREAVDQVIEEEKAHVRQLSALLKDSSK
jgi:rubrerythrin